MTPVPVLGGPGGLGGSVTVLAGESQKSGPIGLAVILVLCVVSYLLFKSMSRHMRKVREEFPDDGNAPTATSSATSTTTSTTTTSTTSSAAPTVAPPPPAGGPAPAGNAGATPADATGSPEEGAPA